MAAEQKLSFKKEAFVSGGIVSDGRYLTSGAAVVKWDYDGKADKPTTAFHLLLTPITVDAKGKITKNGEAKPAYWSAGDTEKIIPTKDGTGFTLAPNSTVRGLSDSSNFHIFIDNIILAGFDADAFDNDVTVFDDLAVEIVNIPAPKREGLVQSNLVQAGGPSKPQREKTIPVVKVIGKMAGEKNWNLTGVPATAIKATPAVNGKAETAAADAASEGAEIAAFLQPILNGQTSVSKTNVRVQLFKSLAKLEKAEKDAIMAVFADEAQLEPVLNGIGNGYSIDGNNIVAVG